MVNHYSKRLPSTVIQGVYKITKLDKEIGIFDGLFLILWKGLRVKHDMNN